MRFSSAKINITEYLRPKTKSTAEIYLTYLNKYFHLIFPELKTEWQRLGKRKSKQKYFNKLDEFSIQYLKEERDYRRDLLDCARVFEIPRKFKKDLYGKDFSPIIDEYIPQSEDIRKVHLTLPEKTLVLMLSSSGI